MEYLVGFVVGVVVSGILNRWHSQCLHRKADRLEQMLQDAGQRLDKAESRIGEVGRTEAFLRKE